MRGEGTVTVACYNVHRCVGSDGRSDAARVGSVLREIDAGIVGLQELSSEGAGEAAAHQANYLAEVAGQSVVFGPTLSEGLLCYGNALLTSGKILSERRHDLSVTGREPRGALDVELAMGEHKVRVVVTHIGLRRAERRLQVARLTEILEDGTAQVTMLMGDFNEWRPQGSLLAPLDRRLGRKDGSHRTFPAWLPLFPLDRIWVAPEDACRNIRVHRSPMARRASDHLPLVARVCLG